MIPVTVVGGFLGAGKTTLVNHLLAQARRRYGVLVNDFGAINVDAGLIRARQGDMIALANGCVCCSLGPDLGAAIAALAALDPPPEALLIEASGVSDPRRIMQMAALEAGIAADAVLVLVDAEAFLEQRADPRLADTLARQITRADMAVINKCDRVEEATFLAVAAEIEAINPALSVIAVHHAALPEDLVFATAPHSRLTADTPEHPFRTWHWRNATPFDPARLHALLDALSPAVLRLKGICRVGPHAQPHVLQRVGRRWTLRPHEEAEAGLVLIATADFETAGLDALFQGALLA